MRSNLLTSGAVDARLFWIGVTPKWEFAIRRLLLSTFDVECVSVKHDFIIPLQLPPMKASMRILHTADWHIGHRLYERNRIEEHRQFLEWLLGSIHEHDVDVLVVSGDIFDTALPTSEATSLYYQFLFQLYEESRAQVVITAGNHDSPRHLAAPREFLKMGNIHVVGEIESGVEDCVITLPSRDADKPNEAVAIAAVPYLSERELLSHVSFETEVERVERYREAMRQLYEQCVAHMPPRVPKILMGHLVALGGQETGSERNIQIGGASTVCPGDFPEGIEYVALGHLHRAQSIEGADYPIRYSGSPLPMTFKESEYAKKVCLLDFTMAAGVELTEIDVPVFKELCRVKGDYDQVMAEAMSGDWSGKYIEVQLTLDAPRLGIGDEIREAFGDREGDVLIVEVQLEERQRESGLSAEQISSKPPEEIFEEFYRTEYNDAEVAETELPGLLETFRELVQISSTQADATE